jgi:hypothetical protein
MLRNKIVKQALQQGFASHSRWLLQYLGLYTSWKADYIAEMIALLAHSIDLKGLIMILLSEKYIK